MRASLSALVLAAGEGTRMRSTLPKPLHEICGRPMVLHVLDALSQLPLQEVVVVVGYGSTAIAKVLADAAPARLNLHFVEQPERLGTGDAVAVGLTALVEDSDDGDIVVVPGDTPLLEPSTLSRLLSHHREADRAATILVADMEDPFGYGRVVRNKVGDVAKVVEEADATAEERLLSEVNTSVYCFRKGVLAPSLRRLHPDNAQGEYYLTDVIEVLAAAGYKVGAFNAPTAAETAGVNDRAQLAEAETAMRRRINQGWMRAGVTMVDPENTYVDSGVRLSADVVLLPGTVLKGTTSIGTGCHIGPHSRLEDATVGKDAVVTRSEVRGATVGDGAEVGPFAVLEPGVEVAPGEATGPFFRAGLGGG